MDMEQQSGLAVDAAPTWDRPVIVIPTLALLAAIGGFFPSFSVRANLYALVIGGVMMWLGLSGRVAKRPSPVRLTRSSAWWLVPALVFVVVEVTNFALGSTYPHPTLSLLMDSPLDRYPIRSIVYFAWLGGFWGLVRR